MGHVDCLRLAEILLSHVPWSENRFLRQVGRDAHQPPSSIED